MMSGTQISSFQRPGGMRGKVRAAARQLVPRGLRARYHRGKELRLIQGWHRDWMRLRQGLPTAPADRGLSDAILLIPSDTRFFSGGKGDEAMTVATIEALRSAGHAGTIYALCETDAARKAARSLGCEPIAIAQSELFLSEFDQWLAIKRPRIAVGIGADSIDGAYGVVGPAGLLAVLDLASRRGATSLVTGFSIGTHPDEALAQFFAGLAREVRLNVRDAISEERLRTAYGVQGRLVTDTAFLLPPEHTARVDEVAAWVRNRRAAGDCVLALNVHPMLFSASEAKAREAFLDRLASAMRRVSAKRPISWVLVAHDFRSGDADTLLLEPLRQRLGSDASTHVLEAYETEFRSGELKAIAALLDGVVSARMHFAIASLGSGTPVLALVYKGKFEGLLRHFELAAGLALDPRSEEETFFAAMTQFVETLPELRAQVQARAGHVKTLAQLNYSDLPGTAQTGTRQ